MTTPAISPSFCMPLSISPSFCRALSCSFPVYFMLCYLHVSSLSSSLYFCSSLPLTGFSMDDPLLSPDGSGWFVLSISISIAIAISLSLFLPLSLYNSLCHPSLLSSFPLPLGVSLYISLSLNVLLNPSFSLALFSCIHSFVPSFFLPSPPSLPPSSLELGSNDI